MRKILMFSMRSCPYCREALQMMEQLKQSDSRYAVLEIKIIDEVQYPEIANQYDYYYVPTYYVDGIKLHEGVSTLSAIRHVFDEALKN